MKNTRYQIIDLQAKIKIGVEYTWNNRNRARARAERLNLDYGAHRYAVKSINNGGL